MKTQKLNWNSIKRIARFIFRRKITVYDLDPFIGLKAIRVIPITRSNELSNVQFTRISAWLFFNKESGWGYDFLNNELD
jgi:hypothetical protein